MATGKRKCNMCGIEFDRGWNGIHDTLGYGSEYDGLTIDFDLCDHCLDELIVELTSKCKISPLA